MKRRTLPATPVGSQQRFGILLLGLALMAALQIGVLAPTGAAQGQGHPIVLGYYVPYDPTSWVSLEAHAQELDFVAAQWVTIDGCGNLSSRDDQTLKQFTQRRGVKLVPSLLTLSPWLNHQLLTDDDTAAHAVEQIVNYTVAEGYDGFDLDLESIDAADRPYFTRFVSWLAPALHDNGKVLTLAIPAKERDVSVGWGGAYDYAMLGQYADLITVMAYEYRGPFSGPGSVAPYDWVNAVAAFSTSQIPADKVLLALAFYGYDWNTTSGTSRSIGFAQARALGDQYGTAMEFDDRQQSATFTYVGIAGEPLPSVSSAARVSHRVTVRDAPACDVANPTAPAPPVRGRTPVAGTAQNHEVWLEESASAEARVALAARYALGGVATWRLGLEDPAVWEVFAQYRAS